MFFGSIPQKVPPKPLTEVILDFSTLRGTKPQILTPKSWYDDYPCHFYMGVSPPGKPIDREQNLNQQHTGYLPPMQSLIGESFYPAVTLLKTVACICILIFYLLHMIVLHKASDTPGDFIRRSRQIWSPVKIARDFRHRLMRTHLAIFFADRGDVAVLKTHAIKSPNLMGWLYWRFAAIIVENRGNGHTWRMPANLVADIWHAIYRRFYTPIAAIGENRNRCTGHTWRFSPIAAIGV